MANIFDRIRQVVKLFLKYIYIFHHRPNLFIGIRSTLSIYTNIEFLRSGRNSLTIGEYTSIEGRTYLRVSGKGRMQIGNRCNITNCRLQANQGALSIGDGTFLNHGCIVTCTNSVLIGKDCAFGTNVSIYDHDHVFIREGKQPWGDSKSTPIVIGDNCWIGCNVVILRGSIIGSNCVIGAGTVVKGVIPDHSLVISNNKTIIKDIQ